MVVEYATTDSFADARRVGGAAAVEETGFTARVELGDLPAGQRIAYRVLFQDLADLRTWSRPAAGSFRTPPGGPRSLVLAWSADTAGQGWGINREWGGMRLYETMRRAGPDVFIHLGDTVYAESEVLAKRESKSRPDAGIVNVRTIGKNQDGTIVCTFDRSILVQRRGHALEDKANY